MNSVVFLDVGFLFSGSPGDISVYNEMSPLSFALCCFNVTPPPSLQKQTFLILLLHPFIVSQIEELNVFKECLNCLKCYGHYCLCDLNG